VGSQVSVVVFTRDNVLLNTLAKFHMWIQSYLSYAF